MNYSCEGHSKWTLTRTEAIVKHLSHGVVFAIHLIGPGGLSAGNSQASSEYKPGISLPRCMY